MLKLCLERLLAGTCSMTAGLQRTQNQAFLNFDAALKTQGAGVGGLEGWGISVLTIQSLVSLSYFFCYICEEKKIKFSIII